MSPRVRRSGLLGLLLAGAASVALAAGAAPAQIQADRLVVAARSVVTDTHAKEALVAWAKALAAAEAAYPAGHPQIGVALTEHAFALQATSDLLGAETEMSRAVELLKAAPSAPALALVRALLGEGALLQNLGHNDRAEPVLDEALAAQLRIDPGPTRELAEIRFDRALLRQQQGDIADALTEMRSALAIRQEVLTPGDPDLILSTMAYGNLLQNAGRLIEAEGFIRTATDDALKYLPPDHPNAILAMQTLASLLKDLGRTDEAASVQQKAVKTLRASAPVSDLLGQALGLLGFIRMEQGRAADAEVAFLEAKDMLIKVHGHDSRVVAFTLANAAGAERQQEKYALAAERYGESLAIMKAMGDTDPFLDAQVRQQYAASLDMLGRHDEALAAGKSADAYIRATLKEGDPRRVQSQVAFGWLLLRDGQTKEGVASLTAAADSLMDDVASRVLTPSQSNARRLKANIDRVMVGLYLDDDMERGFRLAQLSMETEAGRAAAALTERRMAGSESLADLLRQRQTLGAERERTNANYLARVAADPVRPADLSVALKKADSDIADLDTRLEREFPHYRVLAAPQTLDIKTAQSRLSPDEALIVPTLAGDDLITIALTRTQAVWDRTTGEQADARALIGRVRASLGHQTATRAAVDASGGSAPAQSPSFDREAAFDLYQAIFTPKIRAVTAGAKELSVAAGPTMSLAPFAVLVTGKPKGDDRDLAALRVTPWLIRTAAVQAVPAIRAMSQADAPPLAGSTFFGAGAPTLRGAAPVQAASAYFRDGRADLASLKSLPPLPAAEGELEAMANALGRGSSEVLVGDAATEAAVKSADLSHARVVAFATHGLVGGDLSGLAEPGLVFTPPDAPNAIDDGVLTASEASRLKLNADWVILSACNTAAGETANAPGYTGLARAFIFAGGRRVLASHWPVRDDAAARLTVETVRATAKGARAGRALQQAMLKLIDDRSVPGGSDPAVWAPFVVVGR